MPRPFLATQTATRTGTTVAAAAVLAVTAVALSFAGGMMAVAGFVGPQRQNIFRIAAVPAGPAERDTQRIGDVRAIQAVMEIYFADKNSYPFAHWGDGEIGNPPNGYGCFGRLGWEFDTECMEPVLLAVAPRDPSGSAAAPNNDRSCQTADLPCNYAYRQGDSALGQGNPRKYEIHFRLEAGSGDLLAGLNCASELGVGPTCSHLPCQDADRDGYGSPGSRGCSLGDATDCNDADWRMHPNNLEWCDLKDNDCDGAVDEPDQRCDVAGASDLDACSDDTYTCTGLNAGVCTDVDTDADDDGYSACSESCTTSWQRCDCNDTDRGVHVEAVELCDTIDNNCDGTVDEGCVTFRRGDANRSGGLDISDAIFTLKVLFVDPNLKFLCDDAADSNDDGRLDIADAKNTLGYLFTGEGNITLPGPTTPGPDPTADTLGCAQYP
ncbi:MAG: putative metal-binding motif-containing protein [bacterium]|nr:putative metal-binding motif-containing protein [bacterium]